MGRSAPLLEVSEAQRQELEQIRSSTMAATRRVLHAHALLLAANGLSNVDIARRFGVAPRTVATWRTQFLEDGVASVHRVRDGRIVPRRLPDDLAAQTFRHAAGRGGHLRVVGLYLSPAQRAVALGVGRSGAEQADGFGYDQRCHSHQDFLLFVKRLDFAVRRPRPIHVLLDDHSPQAAHFSVDRWLSNPRRERFQLHVTSSPSAWLGMVDQWLRPVIEQLALRDGGLGDHAATRVADGLGQATGQWVRG